MKNFALLGAVSLCTFFACQNTDKSAAAQNHESTSAMKNSKKGYQLYTVREALTGADSIAATLSATREMGYEKLESFGYMDGGFLGLSTKEFNAAIANADLILPSSKGDIHSSLTSSDAYLSKVSILPVSGAEQLNASGPN